MDQDGPTSLRLLLVLLAAFVAVAPLAAADPSLPTGVRVADGFEVTEFVTDEQARDIYCLTFDAQGRLLVSSAGYIRIAEDKDGDGRAETIKTFANGPQSGAQGLYGHGRSVLAVGDAGLLRYRDQNADDVADGPPDVLLKLQTGGEHDVHSVQLGPDGFWYLIAGNTAKITAAFATLSTSPVKRPRAGALLRFRQDLSAGEIYADGLRNAYDFTFGATGDLFTYDSDDERDISLPWYRPTRVFQMLPGSDHGWVSRSWKRPNYFLDMPPVLGSFGRGSPTGLTCYRHTQFPSEYHGAIFALDWTYGRVICLKPQRSGETWSATNSVFLSGADGHGFAPTDAEVGPDGCLYVSVGGRGTRGAVYRVAAKERPPNALPPAEALDRCLQAPQPLASWSRARWMPEAKTVGRAPFVAEMQDSTRSPAARLRAIEIVTELFGGLTAEEVRAVKMSDSAEVRARAVWSHGRSQGEQSDPALIGEFLLDADPVVGRAALEVAMALNPQADWKPLVPGLAKRLGGNERFNRFLAAVVVSRSPEPLLPALSQAATADGPRAVATYAAGWLSHPSADAERVRRSTLPMCVALLKGDYPTDLKLDALRLLQWMLGDLGPSDRHPPAFDGYAPGIPLEPLERELDPLRIQLVELYPLGIPLLDTELSRVLAMLAPANQALLEKITLQLTAESDPIDDIHHLLVAARLPISRTVAQRQRIAEALVRLDAKFAERKLPQDSAWNDRIKDLYLKLTEQDEFLAPSLVDITGFGRPGHVLYMSQIPGQRTADAIQAFARQAGDDANYPWNNDVVFVLAASDDPAHRELMRRQYDRFSVRGAVVMSLAENPEPADQPKFLEGLESSQIEVVTASLDALEKLPAAEGATEQLTLLRALRRLGQDEREYQARDRVVKLLERSARHKEAYVFGAEGRQPQAAVVALWTAFLQKKWPKEAAEMLGDNGDQAQLLSLLAGVDWSQGDRSRGKTLYEVRACGQCHGGRSALGPDLNGVASRFSKEDLFTSIVAPSRDVSARYQTTIIETKNGKVHSGLIVYESVDGLLLRNATHQTFRIETSEIEERRKSPVSLMPTGLLKDLKPADYADLYAYLSGLGRPAAAAQAPVRTQP